MKTLKETYQIVLDHLTDPRESICLAVLNCVWDGTLTPIERITFDKHFNQLKPCFYHEEFYNKNFNTFNRCSRMNKFERGYWWSLNEAGLERRRLFIEKIIKSL